MSGLPRRLGQSLITLAALAGTGLYIEAELQGVFQPVDASSKIGEPRDLDAELPGFDLEGLVLTTDEPAYARPVFRPTRRPLQKTVAAVVVAPPLGIESLRLQGIIIDHWGGRAFITSPQEPQGEWYRAGGEIEDWRIEAIDFSGVDLRRAAETERLDFTRPNGSKRSERPFAKP